MNMITRSRDQEFKGSRVRGFWGKLTLRSVLLAFSVAALAVTQAARAGGENANVFYVDDANGSDSNSGQTPDQALKTIKAALEKTKSGDTVWVNDGTYDSGEMGDLASANGGSRIVIPQGVTVRSVNGRAKTLIVGRKATTVLSGGGCGTDSLRCAQLMKDALLIGFTLTNGYSKATTSKPDGGANGGGVLSASGAGVIDCTITKCVSANIGGVGQYGSYIGCRMVDCGAVQVYAKGVRDPALICNCWLQNLGNGYVSTTAGSDNVFNSTFVFASGEAIFHNYGSGHVYNCRLDSSGPTIKPDASYYNRCRSLNGYNDKATLLDDSTNYTNVVELRDVANEEYLDRIAEKFREWARTIDADGNQRIMNGQMDVGGTEYDIRPDFSHVLAADGSVDVQAVGPRTAMNENETGVVIASNETMTAVWQKSPFDVTTFRFVAALADGAKLFVYTNGTLCTTVTESQAVSFDGVDSAGLRLVAEGAVTVSDFRNGVVAVIDAPLGGVSIEGATNGVNYVTDKPLTFTIRPVYDSYDQYSTGFRSNGVDYVWADFPNGFTHTVKDASSEIVVNIVYTAPGSLKDWYVDPVNGSDTNNFGRVPTNPVKTLAKAAKHATSGQIIHAAAGTYDEGIMGVPGDYSRVVVPKGVTLKATGAQADTIILGKQATEPISMKDYARSGVDSARCVYLNKNCRLEGFTLLGGCTTYANSKSKTGGGVYAVDDTCRIVNCRITDCYSTSTAGAGENGLYLRCRIDQCKGDSQKGGQPYGFGLRNNAKAYNCLFYKQRDAMSSCKDTVCCTFYNDDGSKGERAAHNAYGPWYGNVYISTQTAFTGTPYVYATLFYSFPTASYMKNFDERCHEMGSVSAFKLGKDGAPLVGSPVVDAGITYTEYTNVMLQAGWTLEEASVDYAGNPRCSNGRLDCGAYEYDWRPDFSLVLSSDGRVRVGDMGPLVTTNESQTAVRVPNDQVMVLACSGKKGSRWIFEALMSGEGNLAVVCGGVPLQPFEKTAGGVWRYSCPMLDDVAELSIVHEGAGHADVSSFRNVMGMCVIFD